MDAGPEPFALSSFTLGGFLRIEIRGAGVSDAHLAALAIEHGCELVTTDGDFARFPDLRWRHPLAAR